ncbi:hypothetical protein JTB14_033869 [Gonioctena quinquepunctata]|nr:hypothetical protein JTB14_033869 [Gonioctena quinquepunctata]
MKPKQYIKTTNDRITISKEKAAHQRKQAEVQRLRYTFNNRSSMRTLTEPIRRSPDLSNVTEYYQKLYTQQDDAHVTPTLNTWLGKLQKYPTGKNYNEQVDENCIKSTIEEVITKTSPWKSPGEDCIPNYLYKMLPGAKKHLIKFISRIIQGKENLEGIDVRANVILIYKKGKENDPANYRPIALLNTEYKILTETIAEILKKDLPEWDITQLARMRRKKHYSAWYHFRKAYDSISHRQLKRLIGNLPLHMNIKNVLRGSMNLWSVRVEIDQSRTKPIYIKRGVYQGDSISRLLFILFTAGIMEHIEIDLPKANIPL